MIDIADLSLFEGYLRGRGLVGPGPVTVRPLSGGVSCEVLRVDTVEKSFVVKQARAKLKVAEDWFSDTARLKIEKDGLIFYQSVVPSMVPHFLFFDADNMLFGMEAAPPSARMWKALLMEGQVDPGVGLRLAEALALVHNAAARDEKAKETFASPKFFIELRIDPYLRISAERHPDLAPALRREIDRLLSNRLTLVHGDYSPKNVLMAGERLYILDFEVAHIGDPSFDLAFLTNHFMLKAVKNRQWAPAYLALMEKTARRYLSLVDFTDRAGLEADTVRTLGGLFLARVDGKSPAEYLTRNEDKELVRAQAARLLKDGIADFGEVAAMMTRALAAGGTVTGKMQ